MDISEDVTDVDSGRKVGLGHWSQIGGDKQGISNFDEDIIKDNSSIFGLRLSKENVVQGVT